MKEPDMFDEENKEAEKGNQGWRRRGREKCRGWSRE
jgi:hypothetical protein